MNKVFSYAYYTLPFYADKSSPIFGKFTRAHTSSPPLRRHTVANMDTRDRVGQSVGFVAVIRKRKKKTVRDTRLLLRHLKKKFY